MPNQTMPDHEPTEDSTQGQGAPMARRTVVAATGLLAVAAAVVGCSSYGTETASGGATTTAGAGRPPAGTQGGPPAGSQGETLGTTAEIPSGGGRVFPAQEIVVTQPEPGTFRAFSAICTHQSCTMKNVQNGTINCPCHGSKFAVADGSVVHGPAKKPLPARAIAVEGTTIRVV
ncbi:MAG: Rieske (2Fe-2S) protein [Pseudonocardiaceae bacterium]